MSDRFPHGKTEPKNLESFEKALGKPLPESYKAYLFDYNGGLLERLSFYDEDRTKDFTISSLFGLHLGPKEKRLQENCKPWNYYDLEEFKEHLQPYICIGDGSTGALILLHLENGSIHILVTDIAGQPFNIVNIADSFDAFRNSLLSAAEYAQRTSNYELEQRLAEMRAIRARDVEQYLKGKGPLVD
ncbi:SMI1/KNR4 family protein [Actibacterium sp. XHP0104]|uniref:SMI1/KNR4 family protein n=1 Tax=Actibacterium sp. XHP0104 TaxID=2984335 RepID=UPI0021E84C40|nr:SMI1/KNR4 family protein [Actibacterium sp. XHP0104]MCV2883057.1 SMI1/KNR4 family protein [Actibacterium sp. XHP0104]